MPPEPPPVYDLPEALPTPVTVVGDIHLSEDEPEVHAAFLRFLEGLAGEGGSLVLLGDIFNVWLGDPQVESPLVAPVIARLRVLADAGMRLCFQAGNRDFLFRGAPGLAMDLWPDLVRTTWGERVVLLTHGDLLCTSDVGYQRLRRVVRGWPGRFLDRVTPWRFRNLLAQRLRRASRRKVRVTPLWIMDIDYVEARRWLEAFDADVLVAGHVHTGVHHRLDGDRPREVFVLKDWERGGSVIRFDGEAISMHPLSLET